MTSVVKLLFVTNGDLYEITKMYWAGFIDYDLYKTVCAAYFTVFVIGFVVAYFFLIKHHTQIAKHKSNDKVD